MKKTILAMAVTMTIGMASAFANKGEEVSAQVNASFNKDFVSAKNVSWQHQDHYNKATFTLNDQVLFAYYKENGDLMAVIRNVLSDHLPIQLLADLRKDYSDYWVSDLFEMASDGVTAYYVTVENANESLVLKSDGLNGWSTFKKTRKI